MDTLNTLMHSLSVNAEVFFSGKLCGLQVFDEDKHSGVLHFLKSGSLTLQTEENQEIELTPNSVIFIPDGTKHRLKVKQPDDAELVCAMVKVPTHQREILIENLPRFICLCPEDSPELSETVRGIFVEAFSKKLGQKIMIDRLCDIFIVQILRYVIDQGFVNVGKLSGSSHPGLAPLLKRLQQSPEHDWSLEEMAESTAMSRSKFSALFKKTLGMAPLEYITELRLTNAKTMLMQNIPVNVVANKVGYETPSSLARVFKKRFAVTPKQWLKEHAS